MLSEKKCYRWQANMTVLLTDYEWVLSQNYSTQRTKLERRNKTQIRRLKFSHLFTNLQMTKRISSTNPIAIITHRPTAAENLKVGKNTKKKKKIDVTDFYKNRHMHWNEISRYTIFLNILKSLYICFWLGSPPWARVSSFTRFLDHTQRRITM